MDPINVVAPQGAGHDGVSQAEADILLPKPGDKPVVEEKAEEEAPPEEEIKLDEEKPLEDIEEKLDDIDEEEEKPGRISFSEIKKDFPNLFKKYPQLQANYFKAEKYEEIFPTIEDATFSSKKAELFDIFDAQVSQGDFTEALNAVHRTNPQALETTADTILPHLYSINPQLYVRAVQPILKQLLGTAMQQAERSKDDNLKNAALVFQNLIWGKGGVPPEIQRQTKPDPEKLALQEQRNNLLYQTASSYEIDAKESAHKHLTKLVEDGIDPENKLTQFTKTKLIEQVVEDLNTRLANDPATQTHMQALWKKAAMSGFPAEMKPIIIRAFLGRAKTILPAIRQKRKTEAFGLPATPEQKKTSIPSSSGAPKGKVSQITPREAKKEGLSEMDIILRGA